MIPRDLTFVLGGARSGKSVHAEQLASDSARPVTYIATARLADAVAQVDAPGQCILIDCLTLWLANLLCPPDGTAPSDDYLARFAAFEAALGAASGKIIIVSNEIGLGVVPMGAATRLYVDELGRLNQRIAALSTLVTMMVAGLPLALKTAAR
jgi:adenosylcobinamide kinase/adenosylcobinamide-phosphate guanylyltransferase